MDLSWRKERLKSLKKGQGEDLRRFMNNGVKDKVDDNGKGVDNDGDNINVTIKVISRIIMTTLVMVMTSVK